METIPRVPLFDVSGKFISTGEPASAIRACEFRIILRLDMRPQMLSQALLMSIRFLTEPTHVVLLLAVADHVFLQCRHTTETLLADLTLRFHRVVLVCVHRQRSTAREHAFANLAVVGECYSVNLFQVFQLSEVLGETFRAVWAAEHSSL